MGYGKGDTMHMGRKVARVFVLIPLCLHEMVMVAAALGIAPTPAPGLAPVGAPGPAPVSVYRPKIDTHTHFIPPFYRDLLHAYNLTSGGFGIPQWNASFHLALNEQYNIKTSVISVSTPGAKLLKNEPVENGRNLARELNLYAKNLTVTYPKKFLFFATLTLPDLEGAVAEAIYALDTLGAAGVIVEANAFGELLGTRRYDPLYKVLNDRKAVVFIHPSNSPCAEAAANATASAIPPYIVDFLLDTVRAAAELVFTNVTTDFPDITFILAHSGGFLPFAATRTANGLAVFSGIPTIGDIFLERLSEFNVDLALSATRYALPSTLAFINESKITFGSDFPYSPVQGVLLAAQALQSPPVRLRKRVVKKISYTNAYDLFEKFLV